jgi:alcohol dehydrogenase class IV
LERSETQWTTSGSLARAVERSMPARMRSRIIRHGDHMTIHRFAFPTAIHFGAGASAQVGPHLADLGRERPLVVTDRALARLPVAQRFVASLRESGLDVSLFDGVFGNPTASQANAGGRAFRDHRADSVVGFGGGAALDVAKLVGILGTQGGDAIEYAWDHPQARAIADAVPYFVALPTTAGTGSEVGRSSVVSEDDTHVKRIVFSPTLLAKAVFADPDLTLELPAGVTAATGMDALTHNVESYLSPAYHPLCDGIALEGVRIAARALPVAVREPRDIAARSDMMMASMMGAIAFQKDLGAVHSCAHALSTVADFHHGLANGVMIDHVMRFNLPAATAKMAELARVAGVAGTATADESAAAQRLIDWLAELKAQIGIPATIGAAKGARAVTRADVPALVAVAVKDICHQTNPRPCTAADFERIFTAAL